MQKVTLLLLFSLVFSFGKAQTNFPFPTDSVEWNYLETYGAGGGSEQYTYFYQNDTIIDSVKYSKLYKQGVNNQTIIYEGAIRTDTTNKVYVFHPDSGKEIAIYNFDLQVGDTFYIDIENQLLILDSIGQIIINGTSRKLYYFDSYHTWVEGIGDVSAFYRSFEFAFHEYGSRLRCFHEGDTLVYLNDYFDDCIYDNTGIEEVNNIEVSISPNPIDNISVLQIENSNYNNLKISTYNTSGRLVTSDNITNNQYIINSNEYASGIHFYRIESNKGEFIKSGKIVIK